MQTKQKTIPGLLSFAIICVLAAFLLHFGGRHPHHLILKPILREENLFGKACIHDIYWLPEHGLLGIDEDSSTFAIARRNTNTGKWIALTAFNQRVAREKTLLFSDIYKLAPKGNWLLWRNDYSSLPVWMANSLDGFSSVQWTEARSDTPYASEVAWCHDGQRWVALAQDYTRTAPHVLVHSLNKSVPTREVPISLPKVYAEEFPLYVRDLLGMTQQNHGIATCFLKPQSKEVDIVEFGIDPPYFLPRKYAVHFPEDVKVEEVALSPQGNCLAWLCRVDMRRHIPGLLRRLMPFLRKADHSAAAIYLSRIDGREMRELGRRELKPFVSDLDQFPQALCWLPEGKEISFICDKTLYTFPVN